MTTKVKNETTRKNRGSRKVSDKVSAKDLQTVVSCVSVSAPDGSGVGSGASGSGNSAPVVGVGSSSASSGRAARMDARTKLENSVIFEGFSLGDGVRDLSAKVVPFFAAPEWSGTAAETVRASLSGMLESGVINQDQFDMMWRAAAKNAGVDLSAPLVSVGRVLVIIRNNFLKEFVSLVGMSFNSVREHIRKNGVNSYSWRLSCAAVRCDSSVNDFLFASPVASGSSASAIVGALLSLRELVDFNSRLALAKCEEKGNLQTSINDGVRSAKRLNWTKEQYMNECSYLWDYVPTADNKQRKQLEKNIAAALLNVNKCNDLILSLGGATVLESPSCSAKVARTIKAALRDRSRSYSVIDTCEKVLALA